MKTTEKIFKCNSYGSTRVVSKWQGNMIFKNNSSGKVCKYHADILANPLPTDISIGNNNQFIIKTLKNSFTVEYTDKNIFEIMLAKHLKYLFIS